MNTASARALARLGTLIWVTIFGGMFAVVLGLATGAAHLATAWSLGVLGSIAIAIGVVLIWVRSRLQETPAGGAQSPAKSDQGMP